MKVLEELERIEWVWIWKEMEKDVKGRLQGIKRDSQRMEMGLEVI